VEDTTPTAAATRDANAARSDAPVLVSIVIAARNVAAVIDEQLGAIAAQDYRGAFEVVVCDNGSSDATAARASAWRGRLDVRVVDAPERAQLSYARNTGAAAARGDLLVFVDADDRVAPGWLSALVGAAADADLVGGRLDAAELNDPDVARWRPPHASGPSVAGNFLPFAPGGNLAIWSAVFAAVPFSTDYERQQDIELSWRAQLAGYRLGFARDAVVHYRHRDTLRGLARQAYGTGVAAAHLYRDFRARGMPPASIGAALRTYLWLTLRVFDLARVEHRGRWIRLAASVTGRAAGSLKYRVLYL